MLVKIHHRSLSFFVWLCAAGALVAESAPLARTLSTSRQFIVFGGDARLRGSVADAAEQTKAELLALLQVPDRWSVPILLNLQQPQANVPEVPPVALNFSQTGAGLKIQLDLLVDRAWDPQVLRREVVRALLLEMSYRTLPSLPAGEVYNPPPEWLVEGVLNFSSQSSDLYDTLESEAAQPPPLKNFLALHPALLDSQSRALYRACATALLRALVASANGPAQLARYIADWPHASADAMADLRAHFPVLGKDEEAMEKYWSASVARSAREQRFALLTFAETSEQLDRCLRTSIGQEVKAKEVFTLEEAGRAGRARIDQASIRLLVGRLMLLRSRAHPLLRSIVADYQTVAETVARGRTRGLEKRLAATAMLRKRVALRMREVDDYMNWFEATQSQSSSGTFREYVRAAAAKDESTRRHDPLSIYLDAMETEVQ